MYRFIVLIIISILFNISATATTFQTKNVLKKSYSERSYSPAFPLLFSALLIQQPAIISDVQLDDLVKIKKTNHGLKTLCFYRNPFDKIPLEIGLITSLKPIDLYQKLMLKGHSKTINQLAIFKTLPFTKAKITVLQELFENNFA